MNRQIPVRRRPDGRIECDVCPVLASTVRPESKNRELAYYCDYCARRYLGWGDTSRPIERAER